MAKTQTEPSTTSPMSSSPDDEAAPNGANRRQHVRVQPDASNPLAARLASGAEVRLIDLSRSGAQFECDRRFLPNATVSLRLVTKDDVVVISGRVVRSRIVRLASGGLGYVVAVAFNELLSAPIEPVASTRRAAPSVAPAPIAAVPAAPELVSAADAAVPAASAQADALTYIEPEVAPEALADISAEEALAFEAAVAISPAMLTLTAAVDSTSEQIRDMFNGNDW